MSTIIQSIEKEQLRPVPPFAAGDRVRVHFQVIEGTRTRTQVFEGAVIKRQGSGARETFTVRKQSFGVGVERTFPVHSPKIEKLEVAGRGDVRRAKLYYLRDRVGKAARVAERRWGITDDVLSTEEAETPTDSEGTSQEEAEVEVTEIEGDETAEGGAEAEGAEAAAGDEDSDSDGGAEGKGDEQPKAEDAAEVTEGEDDSAGDSDSDEPAAESEEDSTEDEASERGG